MGIHIYIVKMQRGYVWCVWWAAEAREEKVGYLMRKENQERV